MEKSILMALSRKVIRVFKVRSRHCCVEALLVRPHMDGSWSSLLLAFWMTTRDACWPPVRLIGDGKWTGVVGLL